MLTHDKAPQTMTVCGACAFQDLTEKRLFKSIPVHISWLSEGRCDVFFWCPFHSISHGFIGFESSAWMDFMRHTCGTMRLRAAISRRGQALQ